MSAAAGIVTGVAFVMVPMRDFDAAVDFYGTVLGLVCSTTATRRDG